MPEPHDMRGSGGRTLKAAQALLREGVIPLDGRAAGGDRLRAGRAKDEFQTASVWIAPHDIPAAARMRAIGDLASEQFGEMLQGRFVLEPEADADEGRLTLGAHPRKGRIAMRAHIDAGATPLEIEEAVFAHECRSRLQVGMSEDHIFDVFDAHLSLHFAKFPPVGRGVVAAFLMSAGARLGRAIFDDEMTIDSEMINVSVMILQSNRDTVTRGKRGEWTNPAALEWEAENE